MVHGALIDRLPNLRNLHVFASVAASGSVTRSADNLFRAQSAITRSVKALENELGVTLFERKARGMLLNEYGRVVQQRAIRIEQELMICCIELSTSRRAPPPTGLLHVLLNEQRLQSFVELTRHHHLGTVANLRGVSRTAISVSIRELEQHLQTKLFERSAKGLIPTDAGRIASFRVRRALGELRVVQQEIAAMQGSMEGTVTIGALPLARTVLLPRAIASLLEHHPHLRIRTVESPYETLVAQMLAGDVDFIIGALRPDRKHDELEVEPLFAEPIALVARSGHPLVQKRKLTQACLTQAQWALSRQGSPTRELLARAFSNMGLDEPKPLVETGDLALLRGLLLQTDIITAISPQQLRFEIDNGSLIVLDFNLGIPAREIGITVRKSSILSPVARLMHDEIRRQVGFL
jgi:LysR family transcriptional regulator of gallate degradation